MEEDKSESWFKKHMDTVIVLGGILVSVLWMTSQISDIKKDMAVVKTVLIMKDIMPKDISIVAAEK